MASPFLLSLLVLGVYHSAIANAQPWTTPYFATKVTLLFNGFDLNRNGLHDNDDTNLLADAYVKKGFIWQTVVAGIETLMWAKVYLNNVQNAPLNNVTAINCLSSAGLAQMKLDVLSFAPCYFKIIDTNNNLLIDFNEYSFFFNLFGLSTDVMQAAYNTFSSSNGATGITLTQYINGWMQYYTTTDPNNAYNNILGSLTGPNPLLY
jgi:hypothetical protein